MNFEAEFGTFIEEGISAVGSNLEAGKLRRIADFYFCNFTEENKISHLENRFSLGGLFWTIGKKQAC